MHLKALPTSIVGYSPPYIHYELLLMIRIPWLCMFGIAHSQAKQVMVIGHYKLSVNIDIQYLVTAKEREIS